MRAVVTGGAGFIGSHLIEALVARGDEVVCVERPGASPRWIADLPVTLETCGIHSVAALSAALDGADVVYHLAGLTEARSPEDFYLINTQGTECLLQAAATHGARAPHVVLLSSLAAIGPCRNGELLGPDTLPLPLSHYGHSKLLAECLMHAYADRVPGTIVRLSSVYGPRERNVLTLFKLVNRGVAITVGSWDRELSMVYVRDVADALIAVGARRAGLNRTYCVAHPETVTWRSFAGAVGQALGRRPLLISVPHPVARVVVRIAELCAAARRRAAMMNRGRLLEMMQPRWVCDPSRAIEELGFRPVFAVACGVAETARWYREAQWL